MERRWSERKERRLEVDVCRQGSLLASCFSRDMSMGGVFLCMDDTTVLQVNMEVELHFKLVREEGEKLHKVNARVARIDAQGAGFKFCDFDITIFITLREIMA